MRLRKIFLRRLWRESTSKYPIYLSLAFVYVQLSDIDIFSREKKVSVSPVKVTLTPSKEGDEEPVDKILTLESDEDQDQEVDGETRKTPTLWERSLLMTEQPDEYDSDDDPEYVPPAVIVDTDLEYDEVTIFYVRHSVYILMFLFLSYWMARTTRFPTTSCMSLRPTPRKTPLR